MMTQECKIICLPGPEGADPERKGCCEAMAVCLDPEFFKALCDPTRLFVLLNLATCTDACTVSQVAACCDVDLSVVSRHLATLRDAGIAHSEKRGKEVFYSIRYEEVVRTLRALADAVEACCPKQDGDCCRSKDDSGETDEEKEPSTGKE